MSVGIKVGSIIDEIGAPSFFNAFFSTVTGLLENNERGSKYPAIARLYEGRVDADHAAQALTELKAIRSALASFPPSAVIWDLDDRTQQPPWGTKISPRITSMANYFVSSTGRDLFDLLIEAFEAAAAKKLPAAIESF